MSVTRGPMYYSRPGSARLRRVTTRLAVPMSGAVAAVGATVLCLALAAAGQERASWLSLALFAALAGAVGRFSRPWAAPVVAVVSWLFYDGFVAHRYGDLAWSGSAAQLPVLVVTAAVALVAALPGAMPHRRVRAAVVRPVSGAGVPEQAVPGAAVRLGRR
ncbi:hypothetical protein [Peterkaempfera sp. SMS 1(5)a]|uniref:hypothetical protein n=1 Tax=Peterkaempfera podocarpi TaxID=3232308 RepID=UPI00366D1A59